MELHILLAGVEFGPYTDDKARQLLDEGFLSATDPAKRLDETDWLPLSDVLAFAQEPVLAGGGNEEARAPRPEFRSLAAALEDEEDLPVFHAPLPPGTEVAEAPLPDEEEETLPEPAPEPPPPAPQPIRAADLAAPPEPSPAAPKDRLSLSGLGGLTAPSVVSASRVTRAIAPRPSLEPLSPPPATSSLPAMSPAARTTRRLARLAREREEEAPMARPKSTPVASAEIKNSFAAALAKTRSMTGDTAPLPAPTRSGGKPLPKPDVQEAPETTPTPVAKPVPEAEAAPQPPTAPRPSTPAASPSRPPVRTTSLNTRTAPLTTLTVNSRFKRPTVTGSLLAKEALLKAREKGTGLLASRVTAFVPPAADFQPDAPALPRKRVPVKLVDPDEPLPAAVAPTVPLRKTIKLTGRIALPVVARVEPAAPVPEPLPVQEEPVSPPEPPPIAPPAAPVQLRENREVELARPKTSTSRKAIRLTGPISLPGRSTQPTRPGPFASSSTETGPLTTSFARTLTRGRFQPGKSVEPPVKPAAEPAPAPAESPNISPIAASIPDAPAPETRLPDRPKMSLRSLIHPAETAAAGALAAEAFSSTETKTETEATGNQRLSSGSLRITGALRQPAPPRIPIRLSSPSGESLPAPAGDAADLQDVKLSSPVPEEELMNRPASGKIPVHEFPPEGVRVRTRRLTAKVPLPELPNESITSESPARQAPPPLPSKIELPGVPLEPAPTEAASIPAPAPVTEIAVAAPLVESETPVVIPVEPEAPVAEPPPPGPATQPEKVRLRKPVKLELTSRKVQESGKLSLEAFSKLTSQVKPGGSSVTEPPPGGAVEAGTSGDEFSARRLDEAPPLTWASARRAAPFPLEWIFYGIVILGLVAGVPVAYLLFHHARPVPATSTASVASTGTSSTSSTPSSAGPPASAAPPANASAPPAVAPPVPSTNASPAPVPSPSSPAQDAARQASAFVSDGSLKYQHGDFEAAIGAFNQALALDPKSTEALFNRGIAKAAHDDLDGAVADYSAALGLDPNLAQAYYYRGLARHSKQDLDGAISDYNDAVRIDPKNALAFFNRGLIRMQKDDIDGAIVDSTTALELDPKLIQSYYDRGLGRLAKGASDSALADMKTFTQLAPQDAYTDYARLYIWLIQTQQGQLAEANQELSAAMNGSWNGNTADMVTRIGEFLLGQISESDLVKASESSMPSRDQGQRCEAWYFIGMRKLEAGDKDGAAEALRKCVDTQKTDYCEFILAQEELKKLMPGSVPEPETLPAPRAQAAGLPDPGTMAPPDTSLPPIPH